MDEGNVGKDLAIKQKQEYEEEILKTIKQLKSGMTTTIGGMEITNYGGQATIKIEGIDIAFGIVDKDGNFTYSKENFLQAKKALEEEGLNLEELGLPDIEQWIDEQEQERDEMEKGENSLSKDMGEKKEDKPEREEPEERDGDEEEKQPANKKFPKKDSGWIEIKSDRETDEMRTFYGMIKKEYPNHVQGAERFFIAPNPKDANDYNLYTTDAQGNVVNEIPLEHTEGKNPMDEDVLTYGKDGSNSKTQQPVQILKIGNSVNGAMLVITKGTRTGTQVHIGNRSRGDDYNVHQISSSLSQKDIMDAEENVREGTSSSYGEREEGTLEKKYYDTLEKLEKQGIPDKSNPAKDNDGISFTEVEKFDDFRASFAKTLVEEYGISESCAARVAVEVLEKGQGFEKAIEQGILEEEKDKESKGTIPPGSAERFASVRTKSILNGDNKEEKISDEKTPDENPRSRRSH